MAIISDALTILKSTALKNLEHFEGHVSNPKKDTLNRLDYVIYALRHYCGHAAWEIVFDRQPVAIGITPSLIQSGELDASIRTPSGREKLILHQSPESGGRSEQEI